MKLHASLIECDLAYLLQEKTTSHFNVLHSKELMLEFFKKLQGSTRSIPWTIKPFRILLNLYRT
jgi:hypothetical protein